jgi:hypothetical protein
MLALQPHLSAKFKKEAVDFLNQCLGMYVTYFQRRKSPDPMAEAMLFGAVLDGIMFDLMVAQDKYPLEAVIQMAVKKFA